MFKQGPRELRSSFCCLSAYSYTQIVSFPPFWLCYPFTDLAIFLGLLAMWFMTCYPAWHYSSSILSSYVYWSSWKNHLGLLSSPTPRQIGYLSLSCEFGPWRLPKGTILASNLFASFLFFSLIMCDWYQTRYFLALSHAVLTTALKEVIAFPFYICRNFPKVPACALVEPELKLRLVWL